MPFVKGQSGNPGGMPKDIHDIKVLAARHGPEAVEALVAIMRDSGASPPARVAAAVHLLDRGYGKAAQPVTGADGVSPVKIVVDTGVHRD